VSSTFPTMTAFAAPAPVAQSAFVGRAVTTSVVRSQSTESKTTTAQLKLPKMPNLPSIKLPSLPSFGKAKAGNLGKSNFEAAATSAVAAPVKLSVAGKQVLPSRTMPPTNAAKPSRPTASAFSSVKFYNPATARYVFSADSKGHGSTEFDVRVDCPSANARANVNNTFRNMDAYTSDLIWARPGWSPAEAEVAVRAVLRNVLGNAYVLEEELASLASEISCYKQTAETKEFVRAIALSTSYKSRFFDGSSNMRFCEILFKHFYGRAARTQAEISEKIQILTSQGYNATINSMVDSDEYDTLWGDQRVPEPNFRGGHLYNKDMNTLAILNGGYGKSDRLTTKAVFGSGNASGSASGAILKGLPEAWRGENTARDAAGPVRQFSSRKFWNPAKEDVRTAELAWRAKFGGKWWYNQSAVFKEVMQPKLSHSAEESKAAAAALKYGCTMGKYYHGPTRYSWDIAPVIEMTVPTSADGSNGVVSLAMREISFSIPGNLTQNV
jgi:hypothetical protein